MSSLLIQNSHFHGGPGMLSNPCVKITFDNLLLLICSFCLPTPHFSSFLILLSLNQSILENCIY